MQRQKLNQSRPTHYDSATSLFCMLDFHFRISQAQYRGQTRYTNILDSKSFSIHIIVFDIDWS